MEKQWFAIHTYSGYENRVKTAIEHKVQLEGYRQQVGRVVIPQKKYQEMRNGKKHDVMRNIMPGYVLIETESNDDIFDLVTKVPGVSSFLGDAGKPTPLSQNEVDQVLDTVEERPDRPKALINYRISDQVKVTEGPFANFSGVVEHVDQEKGKLKVMVSIFGRPTSVELDVLQVESV
ncbi:transcription termination/antitermination protein NusG [candidate division BRC1 bacterium HGW-BRC1-1]|jgi:transcriptional antiterminator NusG|nr:MAG: transcription termination/antitermination protein NusG [candidate division BRC1 bacterium HGW-BRC1-1]